MSEFFEYEQNNETLRLIQHMDDEYPEDWDGTDIRDELRRQHDEIEALKAERDALLAALRPFAALLNEHHERMRDDQPIFGINNATFNVGELRRAKAAIDAARSKT